MRTLAKTRITITIAAAAFMLATTASMMFAPTHAESSIRVTQSTEDGTNSLRVTQSNEEGLEVKCEGNLNCEIIGDDTVVATSEGNTNNTGAVTTSLTQSNTIQSGSDSSLTQSNTIQSGSDSSLTQSNTIQSGSDLDVIADEQDLDAMIEGMVNRLLDEISGKLTNSLSLFRVAY
jgi:hypothetical protein